MTVGSFLSLMLKSTVSPWPHYGLLHLTLMMHSTFSYFIKSCLNIILGSVNFSRILSAFKSSCIPGVLQQLQVSMVAHNGCLRKLCLWFVCASRVVGKLIFKSVVGKQNSTVIYHTLPPSQLWQIETWQLRSCQLESCSWPVLWMNTSHCWDRRCFSWSFGKNSWFSFHLPLHSQV